MKTINRKVKTGDVMFTHYKQDQLRTTYCKARPVEDQLSQNKTTSQMLTLKQNQYRTTYFKVRLGERLAFFGETS